jgi:inorganic pyrophosphatase
MLDRVLATPVVFPVNYGFIPKTIGLDNDPLDMMVIASVKIPSLTLVNVRVLGVMRMIDTGEVDDKVIGVVEKDPVFSSYKDITDVPSQTINKIKAFFETYKILDNKKVTVLAFENKMSAYATIEDCKSRYRFIYGH